MAVAVVAPKVVGGKGGGAPGSRSGQGNGGGWPSGTGNPSGGGRSNAPAGGGKSRLWR